MIRLKISPAYKPRPVSSPEHHPEQNHLLAGLLPMEFKRLLPHLQLVPMPLGSMVYRPGEQLQTALFPTTAIVSLHYVTESGASAETAGVGNEGMVGIALFTGGSSMVGSAVVQTAGFAYSLDACYLKQEFARGGNMQNQLLRYTQALITQIAQTAVCNCHHSLEQRLCRWLLLTLDRCESEDLVITQEFVAGILGVRRESVTDAAGALQRAGYINSRRGHISVIDRIGLEVAACECYGVVRKEILRLQADRGH
jgi:CRP-like cAMP-binding protein